VLLRLVAASTTATAARIAVAAALALHALEISHRRSFCLSELGPRRLAPDLSRLSLRRIAW
jgi:hypothetical protein